MDLLLVISARPWTFVTMVAPCGFKYSATICGESNTSETFGRGASVILTPVPQINLLVMAVVLLAALAVVFVVVLLVVFAVVLAVVLLVVLLVVFAVVLAPAAAVVPPAG